MAKTAVGEEIVEILRSDSQGVGPWRPRVGTEAKRVIEQAPPESRETVSREARSILSRCLPPHTSKGHKTGLVIGYIQSGKTLSFTTVSALARDNEFQLVIVITGTTRNLFHQSNERLTDDLALDRSRSWKPYRSDQLHVGVEDSIQSALDRWSNDRVPPRARQTVLLTVMKQGDHLDRIIELLGELELDGVPALVIDDEADQAGLNTQVSKGEHSATYSRLLRLRRSLPHHTYLQYTATPQALLLLNLIDTLAPDFAEVLTPGEDYTGGSAFFEREDGLIRTIPESQRPETHPPLDGPPESLLDALRLFFVGAAATEAAGGDGNRSAMIHPSRLTAIHTDFDRWVRNIRARWRDELESDEDGPDYQRARRKFKEAYEDLEQTAGSLPEFDDIMGWLPVILRETVVLQMNSLSASEGGSIQDKPIWKRDRYYILIGGQTLNRGFTVEGLTVSYMPRGPGVGNADTIQQRARWFGYKADYLGLCRVFLPAETRDAYQKLIEHEEDVRGQIQELQERGVPLRQWKRHFLLDRGLRPTRRSVIQNELRRGEISDWFNPRVPHESTALEHNREVVQAFIDELEWDWDEGHPDRREGHMHHESTGVPLGKVLADLLTELEVRHPHDATKYTGLLLQLSHVLDRNDSLTATVFRMRPKATESYRGLDSVGRLKNLFQGAYPIDTKDIYPGDRKIRADDDDLTIQLHWLAEVRADRTSEVVARDVPVVATYVPDELVKGWVIAEDPTRG